MKKFIKGVRFAPKNYSDEVEVKIQHYKKEGYKLPSRHLLRTEEQLAGIRESAKINTALLDYISTNIREGMSTAEIDHMVYEFTTDHDAIPAPFMYEGFPKSVCTSINDVVCHGIPSTKEFLRSGDIVNVDVSTIYKGYFSDASRMYMIGEVKPEMQRLVQVAKECRQDIVTGSPVQTGDYKAGWRDKVAYESYSDIRMRIFNKTDYQLTHLLEHGHAGPGGTAKGSARPFPHIGPAEQKAEQKLLTRVKVVIKKG